MLHHTRSGYAKPPNATAMIIWSPLPLHAPDAVNQDHSCLSSSIHGSFDYRVSAFPFTSNRRYVLDGGIRSYILTKTATSFPAVRACIFDLDGLLINTEDIITLSTNKLLDKYGRPAFTRSIRAQLMGIPKSTNGDVFHNWVIAYTPRAIRSRVD